MSPPIFPIFEPGVMDLENFTSVPSRSVSSTIITESAPSRHYRSGGYLDTLAAFYLFVRTITGMNFTDNFYDTGLNCPAPKVSLAFTAITSIAARLKEHVHDGY